MNALGKAVWYIECHFGGAISLEDVARAAGLSKFHLTRVFSAHVGQTVMAYVRARRLSEAAKHLVNAPSGILDVALGAGYNSHEAFTRAFVQQFGITPGCLRKTRSLEAINLVEPLNMNDTPTDLPEPRYIDGAAMLIVGLKQRYTEATSAQMPAQWQAFQPHIGHIDRQVGQAAYGVLCHGDEAGHIDYVTGVEVSQHGDPVQGLEALRIAPQRYVVFCHIGHIGHVADIKRTWKTIFGRWFPKAGCTPIDAPQMERYGANFDPRTGEGDIEIWIPVVQ